MPKLYSYVLREDTGFAPNPYHGFCTLACCQAPIRDRAQNGDWVIATGSNAKSKQRGGYLCFAMLVTEHMSFQDYWDDKRFRAKRPNLDGLLEEACGDNMHFFAFGQFCRELGYHCGSDRIEDDVKVNNVLISDDFVYWGGDGPPLPQFGGRSLCKEGRNYLVFDLQDEAIEKFIEWIRWLQSIGQTGVCGKPLDLTLSERVRRKANAKRKQD